MKKLLKKLFPVQTRESEIECAVHNCVHHILGNPNGFSPHEKMRIAHRVNETVKASLQEEHMELIEKAQLYENLV